MKAYRYNSQKREDRKFNCCDSEKNPNNIKFYATNLEYAKNYRYIYTVDGDVAYECTLEVIEISENVRLFNMDEKYATLDIFKNVVFSEVQSQRDSYSQLLANAKKAKERKMWEKAIAALENRDLEIAARMRATEFQALSDFENQNILIAELKGMGFEGYKTKNEIAIF